MCIFQSEQVIKLRFWLKNNLEIFKSPDWIIHWIIMWGAMGDDAKTNQQCRAEDGLASIWNDLPQMFTDKATLWISKETSILCCCRWRTLLVLSLNTQKAADIYYWSVWTLKCWWNSCAKFDSLLSKTYWIFKMPLHVHLKNWTLKFKLLYLSNRICYFNKICSICWLNPHL